MNFFSFNFHLIVRPLVGDNDLSLNTSFKIAYFLAQ